MPLRNTGGDERFESAAAVRQAVLALVGEAAVGREGYTDRGGATPAETEQSESVDEREADRSF